jgi:hypothetical protein
MSISRRTVSLIVAWSLVTTIAQAEERLPFKATFSGTLVSTAFDTDGDGAPANFNVLEGDSNLGAFSLQVLDESVRAEPATCPNGQAGFSIALVTGSSVFRFRRTGDLLFVRPTSQTTCFDPSTGVSFFHAATGDIIGGTGRFTRRQAPSKARGWRESLSPIQRATFSVSSTARFKGRFSSRRRLGQGG